MKQTNNGKTMSLILSIHVLGAEGVAGIHRHCHNNAPNQKKKKETNEQSCKLNMCVTKAQ
jgi:hypothetical protein